MTTFNFRTINFTCTHCQRETDHAKPHIASGFNMYFRWNCVCGKECECMVPFEELVKMMPPDPLSVAKLNSFDVSFCKQAKIKVDV